MRRLSHTFFRQRIGKIDFLATLTEHPRFARFYLNPNRWNARLEIGLFWYSLTLTYFLAGPWPAGQRFAWYWAEPKETDDQILRRLLMRWASRIVDKHPELIDGRSMGVMDPAMDELLARGIYLLQEAGGFHPRRGRLQRFSVNDGKHGPIPIVTEKIG